MNSSTAATLDSQTLDLVQAEFADTSPPLHRIREVRREQGRNLRGLARSTGENIYELEREELPRTDLLLSRLYVWQQMLDVPVSDLLIEPDMGLSPQILHRAKLVQLMKTVKSIQEAAQGPTLRLTETLERQLLDIMPELAEVRSWNSVGQRRTLDELGRAAERIISWDDIIDL